MLFADAAYWIAMGDKDDDLRGSALEQTRRIGARRLITSEMVLTEYLDGAADRPFRHKFRYRKACGLYVKDLYNDSGLEIVPASSDLVRKALELYLQYDDKEWSLTDCASILICRERGITEVLTGDRHFEQAGFTTLLRK